MRQRYCFLLTIGSNITLRRHQNQLHQIADNMMFAKLRYQTGVNSGIQLLSFRKSSSFWSVPSFFLTCVLRVARDSKEEKFIRKQIIEVGSPQ